MVIMELKSIGRTLHQLPKPHGMTFGGMMRRRRLDIHIEMLLDFGKTKHVHEGDLSIQESIETSFDRGYRRLTVKSVMMSASPMWSQGSRFQAASCLNALPVVPEALGLIPGDLPNFWRWV